MSRQKDRLINTSAILSTTIMTAAIVATAFSHLWYTEATPSMASEAVVMTSAVVIAIPRAGCMLFTTRSALSRAFSVESISFWPFSPSGAVVPLPTWDVARVTVKLLSGELSAPCVAGAVVLPAEWAGKSIFKYTVGWCVASGLLRTKAVQSLEAGCLASRTKCMRKRQTDRFGMMSVTNQKVSQACLQDYPCQ